MKDNNYIVYKHTAPNEKVYIGITSNKYYRRWQGGLGYRTQKLFYRAIQKYGWKNIKHEVLLRDLSESEAKEKERELILQYRSNEKEFGYNLTNGGEHWTFTDEVKKKMSEVFKGSKKKPMSEERKKAISERMKGNKHSLGRKISEETKLKISNSLKGRPFTEERIQNIRIGRQNALPRSEETKKKISETLKKYYAIKRQEEIPF